MGGRRTACVFVPEFVAALRERKDPALRDAPFAVAGANERIRAVSPRARASGVHEGMTGVQALAACTALVLLPERPELERHAVDDVVAALRTVSPSVEPAEPVDHGFFHVDPRGLERLHGRGGRGEEAIAERLVAAMRAAGFAGTRAAIAGSRFCAAAAAVSAGAAGAACIIVPPGTEREFLAPLPLHLLPASDELRERLAALGITTLGAFAALPAPSVEVRYGVDGLRAHRRARGDEDDLLAPRPESLAIEERCELPGRAADRAALEPALDALIDRVLARVAAGPFDGNGAAHERRIDPAFADEPLAEAVYDAAANVARVERAAAPRGPGAPDPEPTRSGVVALAVTFTLDDDTQIEVVVQPAAPCGDRRTLAALLDLELERLRFPAPAVEVSLRVLIAAPRLTEQGRLFQRRRVDPERVRRVLARLSALYPVEHGVAAPREAHLVSPRYLRLFTPPRPIDATVRDGRLVAFARPSPVAVRFALGPWRVSGTWWEEPFERDYFEAGTADVGLYWLYRDAADGRWFLHGVFD